MYSNTTQNFFTELYKQNRESTEKCSKFIVQKNKDKLGKRIGINKKNICKSQLELDQVPKE